MKDKTTDTLWTAANNSLHAKQWADAGLICEELSTRADVGDYLPRQLAQGSGALYQWLVDRIDAVNSRVDRNELDRLLEG